MVFKTIRELRRKEENKRRARKHRIESGKDLAAETSDGKNRKLEEFFLI